MKELILIIGLVSMFTNLFSQRDITIKPGAKYRINDIINVSRIGETAPETIQYKICSRNKIKVDHIVGNYSFIEPRSEFSKVKKDGTVLCKFTAEKNTMYFIETNTLKENIYIPEVVPTFGVMSVPFKFQTNDFQIYSSGNIGGFFGAQLRNNWNPLGEDSYWFLVGVGGYSRIPLNNVNSSDPQNVDDVGAVTLGISAGFTIGQFQVMLIRGWDKFNVNDSKQNRNWVSFGLGFGFLQDAN